jgi:hypothetical protein
VRPSGLRSPHRRRPMGPASHGDSRSIRNEACLDDGLGRRGCGDRFERGGCRGRCSRQVPSALCRRVPGVCRSNRGSPRFDGGLSARARGVPTDLPMIGRGGGTDLIRSTGSGEPRSAMRAPSRLGHAEARKGPLPAPDGTLRPGRSVQPGRDGISSTCAQSAADGWQQHPARRRRRPRGRASSPSRSRRRRCLAPPLPMWRPRC